MSAVVKKVNRLSLQDVQSQKLFMSYALFRDGDRIMLVGTNSPYLMTYEDRFMHAELIEEIPLYTKEKIKRSKTLKEKVEASLNKILGRTETITKNTTLVKCDPFNINQSQKLDVFTLQI